MKFLKPKNAIIKYFFKVLFSLPVLSGISYAAEFELKKDAENQFDYFDSTESVEDLHIIRRSISDSANLFKVDKKTLEQGPATICINVYEFSGVEKKFLSSKITIHYKHQKINATKIKSMKPVGKDELASLGLNSEVYRNVALLELSDGKKLHIINPENSMYSFCRKVDGAPDIQPKAIKPVESYDYISETSCRKNNDIGYPILGPYYADVSFVYGGEVKRKIEACPTLEAKAKERAEKMEELKIQQAKEEDDRFEEEKRNHKMTPGATILGDVGLNRAKDLIYYCLRPVSNISFDFNLTKQQWRTSKCGGYYVEEVEGLRREMRLRGLINN